ncbi:MAG: DinB family protein [Candidatus Zixiibacteriota bacterium]|nr:MAG: DinB family protein [candidate division Zixibacteria bacterium]
MKEIDRIRDQLKRAFESDAWHGPSLTEALSGLTAEAAGARPLAKAHTIWEILLHVLADIESVSARLKGERRTLSPEEDWPPPPADGDEEALKADLNRLREVHEQLMHDLSDVKESALDSPIVEGSSSIYVTLHGVVQHNVYHAGQIVLLRKAAEL